MQAFQKVHPLEFQKSHLEKNIRLDSRSLNELRKISISIDSIETCVGSALIKIGNTSVIAGVRAELGKAPTNPLESTIFANIELLPICSSKFHFGAPSNTAQCINAWLNRILRSSPIGESKDSYVSTIETISNTTRKTMINQETLLLRELIPKPVAIEIPEDEEFGDAQTLYADAEYVPLMAWYLYVDLYCLDFDGNCKDAALLAMISALKSTKLPKVFLTKQNTFEKSNENTISLKFNFIPISISFVIIDNQFIIVDPNSQEEDLQSSNFTIILDEKNNIISIDKPGGSSLSIKQLKSSIQVCIEQQSKIRNLISNL